MQATLAKCSLVKELFNDELGTMKLAAENVLMKLLIIWSKRASFRIDVAGTP